jgi:hypothetical protein
MARSGIGVVFLALLMGVPSRAQVSREPRPAPSPAALRNYLQLPLAFERQSQGSAEYYVARGKGYAIGISGGKATIGLASSSAGKAGAGKAGAGKAGAGKAGAGKAGAGKASRAVTLEFAGSRAPKAVPSAELPGKVNYILGNDPKKWQLGLATYARVTYPEVYPGIDVVYYGNGGQLEFDFVVKPGTDPGVIRMKVGGGQGLSIDDKGALVVADPQGDLRIALPRISQQVNGVTKHVAGHYALDDGGEVAFKVDVWDRGKPLLIDPTIVYSTLLGGGTGYSEGFGIALDAAGDIYVTGQTGAGDFPTVGAFQPGLQGNGNGFVSKINAAGNALIYSTYVGGSGGGDDLQGIAVDSTGAAWVTGSSNSTNFPIMNAYQASLAGSYNAVVLKLSASGALQYSTYLGGSNYDYGSGVAVDSSLNAYVTGYAGSAGFPTTSGVVDATYQNDDAFVAKFASGGALVYSTLLGGSSSDSGSAIAADSSGNAYVTGYTNSFTFTGAPAGGAQTTNPCAICGAAFVAKLNATGTALLGFTFLGNGTGYSVGNAIAIDSSLNTYIAGSTTATGLATSGAAQTTPGVNGAQNGFIAKLNAAGTAFAYVTYLGGNRTDYIHGLAVNGAGEAYVTGWTDSANFPVVSAVQPVHPGNGVSLFATTNSGVSWSAFDTNLPGAVYDISPDPVTEGTIVVATETGIYRTVNGGSAWTQSISFGYSQSLARSPVSAGTIYALGGGCDVYQSTNNGVTWSYVGYTGSCGQSIVADGVSAGTAYVFGYNSGVYVTTNGGTTWAAANTGLPSTDVEALVAGTDGSLYAGVQQYGIYKSTNQGASWTAVNDGLPPSPSLQQQSIAISASNPSTLYFVQGAVYVTTNGGTSWAPVSGGPDLYPYWVAVSTQNPSVLYVAGSHYNYMSASYSVSESTDGGTTWTAAGGGLPPISGGTTDLSIDPLNSARVYLVTPVAQNAFAAKLNSAGSSFLWSTYLGGSGGQSFGYGIATNGTGAYITGYTCCGAGFPTTSPALATTAVSYQFTAFITHIQDTTASCTYALNPSSQVLTGYSQSITIGVIAPSGCSWSVTSNPSWTTIISGASGTGTGSVVVQVATNSTGSTLSGTLTIGGQTVTLTQADSSCNFSLNQNSFTLTNAGGTIQASLTVGAGCPWVVTNNNPSAITITSGGSGTGNGTINLTVAPNYGINANNFSLSVGTTSLSISEPGSYISTPPGAAATCASFANTGLGQVARAESATELVDETVLTCSTPSGTPVPASSAATAAAITVFVGAPVTSKLLQTGALPAVQYTEALAVVSNPGGFASGAGFAASIYSATQGVITPAGIAFTGIPTPALTGAAGSTSYQVQFVNIRVNSTGSTSISEQAFISGSAILMPGAPAAVSVATVAAGLAPAKLSTDRANTKPIGSGGLNAPVCSALAAQTSSGNSAGLQTPLFWVHTGETFQTSFKSQGGAANVQFDSEFFANTETGIVPTGAAAVVAGGNGYAFNQFAGGGNQANFGTRIQVVFANVPAGLSLYVPLVVQSDGAVTGLIALTNSATAAFGSPTPVTATSGGPFGSYTNANGIGPIAPLTVTGGSATAVYEVTSQSPLVIEAYSIPIIAVAAAGTVGVSVSPMTATVSFAPLVNSTAAPLPTIPSFISLSTAANVLDEVACPAISSLNPTSAPVDSPSFTLTVNGSGFVSGSTVEWNGTPLATAYTSAAKLTATVTAGLLTSAGTASVTVVNPIGPASGAASFSVVSGALTIGGNSALGTYPIGQDQISLNANGGSGNYTWSVASGGLPPGINIAPIPGSSPLQVGLVGIATTTGNYSFSLTVNDGSTSVTQPFTLKITGLTVKDINLPDTFVGTPFTYTFTPLNNAGGVTFAPTSSPPLPGWLNLSAGAVLSGTPAAAGTYQVNFSVFDGVDTTYRGYQLTVYAVDLTTAGVLPNATQNTAYSVSLASSGGTGGYHYAITGNNLPPGLTLSNGVITGTPTVGSGFYGFYVTTTDSSNNSYQKAMSIGVLGSTIAENEISLGPIDDAVVGLTYGWQIPTCCGGTPPFTWAATGLPAGLSIRSGSGVTSDYIFPNWGEIWGVPSTAGTSSVTVTVTDSLGATSSLTFPLNVSVLNLAPNFSLPNGTINTPYSTTFQIIGGTAPYSSVAPIKQSNQNNGNLPDGLTLNTAAVPAGDFTVAGTPIENGSFNPAFKVTDGSGNTLTRINYFNINNAAGGITINSSSNSVTAGGGFSVQLSACCVANTVWAVPGANLPSGATLSSSGMLSGSVSTPGSYSFLIEAEDELGVAAPGYRLYTLNVNSISITNNPPPYGNVSTAYSATFTATGGAGALTWTPVFGSYLPPGLTLAANGMLSGTPTATGQYYFGVTVTDQDSNTATAYYDVDIYAEGQLPPVTISTGSNFGTWHLGTEEVQLAANGGNGTYAWNLVSGTLPPGLALRTDVPAFFAPNAQAGLIGVATVVGTYNFTLSVTSNSQTASQAFTIKISALDLQDATPPDAFVNTPFTYTFTPIANAGAVTFSVNTNNSTNGAMPPGLTLSSTGTLSGTPTTAGNYQIAMKIFDGVDTQYEQYTLNIYTVKLTTSGTLSNGTQYSSYSTNLSASGGAGGYTYALLSGSLPHGLTLASNGAISGTITGGPGLYGFAVRVTDLSDNSTSKNMSLDVIGSPISPMQITNLTFNDPVFGSHYGNVQSVCCGGTGPFIWNVTGLPPGLTTEPNSNSFRQYPATPGNVQIYGVPQQTGTFNVKYTVTDATGASTSATVPMHVSALDVALPSAYGVYNLPNGTINVFYAPPAFRVLGGSGPYSFAKAASGELPDGLTINSGALTVSGTPLENNQFYPGFQFADSAGNTLFRYEGINIGGGTSTITINGAGIDGYNFGTIPVGVPVSGQFSACCVSSYVWSVVGDASTFPPGISLSTSGQVSGTPTTPGTYRFLIEAASATDPSNAGVKSFMVTVTPITITSSSLPYGEIGMPYSASLTTTGATGSLTWTQPFIDDSLLPPGLTLSPSGTISGTPTSAGAYNINLLATDSSGNTAVASYTIDVYADVPPPLDLPIGPSIGPYAAGPNQLQIPLSASGGTPPYHYSITPGTPAVVGLRVQDGQPLPLGFSAGTTGGLAGLLGPGSYSTSIRVTDSTGATFDRPINFTVLPVDILSWQGGLPKALVNTPYSFQFTPYGGSGTYVWGAATTLPPGLTINSSTGVLSGTPTSAGMFNVVVSVADAAGGGSIARTHNLIVNPFAITDNQILPQATALSAYSYQFNAPDCGTNCTWTLTNSTLPAGFALSSGGLLTGTFTSAAGGEAFLTVQATGSAGTTQEYFTLTALPTASQSLSIATGFPTSAVLGATYGKVLSASGGTPPYTFTLASGTLPPGISLLTEAQSVQSGDLQPAPGLLGRPMAAGTYSFVLQVADSLNNTATMPVSLAVSVVDNLYSVLPINSATVSNPLLYNQAYSQPLLAVGGNGNYTSWTVAGGGQTVYPGLTLNATTGVVSGTPTITGPMTTPITITDSVGNSVTQNLNITVPAIAMSTQTITFNQPSNAGLGGGPVTLNATASSGLPVTYVSNTTGVCTVAVNTNMATLLSAGTCSITASQNGNFAYFAATPVTQTFMVIPPTVTSAVLPGDAVGAAYSVTLSASGGTPPYQNWTVSSGALPGGLTLNSSTGAITGTPTTTSGSPFGFSVTVTDNAGDVSAPQSFSIAIQAQLPTISSLSPASATAGGPAFTLTVAGANFASGCTVDWNGTAIAGSNVVSATQITAPVTAAEIAAAGSVTVTVACGEAASSGLTFSILAPTGQIWTQLMPAGDPPSAREAQSAVFDAAAQQMIIFGGFNGTTETNDTWSLSTSANPQWTNVETGGTPPPARDGHSAVYDSTNSIMTIFGGATSDGCASDVWSLSNADGVNGTPGWTQLTPAGTPPSARALHNAVYDPASNNMIVFGGADCPGETFYNDVWILSHANGLGGTPAWTQLSPTGTPPAAREGASAVYDPVSNELILFGGAGASPKFNDVWILSNANGTGGTPAWTQLLPPGGPPLARVGHTAIYSSAANSMTVYGGSNVGDLSDVWLLTSANGLNGTPAWIQLAPAGTLPPARANHSSVFDSTGNRMIVFGGDGALKNDSWVLSHASSIIMVTSAALPAGQVGTAYSTTLAATGGTPPYTSWTVSSGALPPGLTLNPFTGSISGTPTSALASPFSFSVTVSDSAGNVSPPQSFSIAIAFAQLSITTASLPGGTVGQIYTPVNLQAMGGSGSYYWLAAGLPAGLALSRVGVLSGVPTATGQFSVTVTVFDTIAGTSATSTYSITIASSLSITTTSLPNGGVGAVYGSVTMAAAGGTGNYTWSATGAPAGVAMTAAGVFGSGGAVLATAAAGSYSVTVTVTDTTTTAMASSTFSVTIYPALSVATSTLPNGFVGSTYGPVTMAATGGSRSYSWTVSGAPAGVTMTTAGVMTSSAALAAAAAGSYPSVTVTVTDPATNATASQTYALSIAFAQLTLGGPASLGGFAPSASISASYAATGGDPPYTWSAPGLPAGLNLNATTGGLTGAIAQPGNYSFQIKVADSQTPASTNSLSVSLFVLGIATTALPSGAVNVAYSQTLGTIGGAPPCTWSVTGGALPAGLSLAAATGVLSGTPTASGTVPAAGITSSFTVSVSCGGVTVSQPLSVTVTATLLPLAIPGGGSATPVSVTGGTASTPYSQTLQAVHGQPPYSWQVIGGALPAGLSLGGSGTLSGTPSKAGTSAFTAQVTDTSGAMVASAFAVTIAPTGLNFTTGPSLPNGIVGAGYPPQIMTAAGGIPPYTFTATAASGSARSAKATGALPDGLGFSGGQISGTPTTEGVYAFTVMAADSSQPPLTTTASFQISVEPSHPDLILSQTSLSFALNTGATGLPAGANITVQSSVVQQTLNYSITVTPAASWLDVTGGGATPGAIGITLDASALNLSPSVNQTTIVVTCIAPSPCAGNSQNINVTLNVSAPPPQLVVTNSLLSFTAQPSNPQSVSQTLGIENTGSGAITVNSITAADAFVTISGVPATVSAGPAVPVTVTVNPAGLASGYYQSTIFVNTSAGSANLPVTLLLAQNPVMTPSPAGTQFQMPAGGAPGNPNGSFLVSVAGSSTVSWTAAVMPGASWLTLNTASGSSTPASPGPIGFAVNANAAALTPQAYYALIQVTSSDIANSPQSFLVVLNVAPAASAVQPDPAPAGLLFIASGSALGAQTVQVFASSASALSYQASTDSPWLLVAPATGLTSAAAPAASSVSVNLSGLAAGVYRGNVNYAFSAAAVRSVNVTLIVEAGAAAPANRPAVKALPRATCAPSQLVPSQTGLGNNFSTATSWPTALTVLLVDDCGNAIDQAQVVATFTNGDSPVALNATDTTSGIYAGTWTPRNASGQVTVYARATAPGFNPASVKITGQVAPNAAPILYDNGTLDVFTIAPVAGATVAPGTIVQMYGANLAAQTMPASTIPLPTSLTQTSVFIGGMLAPLYYVSPTQINAQVPFELAAGQPYQVIVSANGALSTAISIQLTADAPSIAQFAAGEIIAQHLDASLVTEMSPAAPGEYIVFYVAGMGLTNQSIPSGTASPLPPNLALPLDTPTLTVNGAPVTNILFAGLTPTLVGLYQVDFQVPANAPNGDLQLVLTQTNGAKASTILPVHN